jgi:hypothetical protein
MPSHTRTTTNTTGKQGRMQMVTEQPPTHQVHISQQPSLSTLLSPWGASPPFLDKEPKAQRGDITNAGSHSRKALGSHYQAAP